MNGKIWTKDDLDRLRQLNNQGLTPKEISKLIPDRTIDAVSRKLSVLGLKVKSTSNPVTESFDEQLVQQVKKQKRSIYELADMYDASPQKVRDSVERLRNEGYVIDIQDEIISSDLQTPEVRTIDVKKFFGGTPEKVYLLREGKKVELEGFNYKFGAISDTHTGSKYERLDVLNALYDIFEREGVKVVLHGGNYVDGEFKFNKFETKTHGFDEMIDYFLKNYPKRNGIQTWFISGDDHEGWWTQDKGIDPGQVIMERQKEYGRDDLVYLGYQEANLELRSKNGSALLRIIHGGGGTAYADSYTTQKMVESYQEGEKPHILLVGHYHKSIYHQPRGIHTVQLGCFSGETPIVTINGEKKIRDIKIGDLVLTHKNIYKKVTKLFKRKYNNNWIRLFYNRPSNVYQSIQATEEHPVLTIDNTGNKIWKKIIDINVGDKILTLPNKCSVCGNPTIWFRNLCMKCNPSQLEENKVKLKLAAKEREQSKKAEYNRKMKELLINTNHRNAGLSSMYLSQKRELEQMKKIESEGFRVIPLNLVRPDFIGIKEGKVTAFEVEYSKNPNYKKYDKVKKYYDGIKWIDISPKSEKGNNSYPYWFDKESGFIIVEVTKKKITKPTMKRYQTVYNFEVEEDNSYIAKKIVVHNCVQDQTRFMRKNKIRAHVGGWLITLNQSPDGDINRFRPEWIHFWNKDFYNEKITLENKVA